MKSELLKWNPRSWNCSEIDFCRRSNIFQTDRTMVFRFRTKCVLTLISSLGVLLVVLNSTWKLNLTFPMATGCWNCSKTPLYAVFARKVFNNKIFIDWKRCNHLQVVLFIWIFLPDVNTKSWLSIFEFSWFKVNIAHLELYWAAFCNCWDVIKWDF